VSEAPPSGAPWFVCHTKPRCEKKFAHLLGREGFNHYLALVRSVRRYPDRTKTFTKPLFPGYVFAQIDPERRARVYQQDLLARVLPVDNETIFLRQLADVRALCGSGLELALHPLLRKGTRVRVIAGPLRGVEGMIEDPAHPKGVIVAVDVLQQGILVRLPPGDLKILP
jgi:transcriptional antiterminator RfaH